MRRTCRSGARGGWVALAFLSLSCASGSRVYVNPDADLAFYKKVAVLPFANLSTGNLAGPRVTRAFVTELIMANRFEVVQPEDFTDAMMRMGIHPAPDGSWDPAKVKDAALQLRVSGLLRGAVSEYELQRVEGGDVPLIAFDAELIDVNTGQVVWKSSISKRGRGRVPIIGTGSRSLGRLTQDACAELVGRLRKAAL